MNTNNIVMWGTPQNNAGWDCFKTLILQETLKTQNQHQVDSCECSEATRARDRLQFHTVPQKLRLFLWMLVLRMDGIPALDLCDLVIEVFHSSQNQINKSKGQESQGNLSRNTTLHMKNQNPTKHVNLDLNNVDFVSCDVRSSQFGAILYGNHEKKETGKLVATRNSENPVNSEAGS